MLVMCMHVVGNFHRSLQLHNIESGAGGIRKFMLQKINKRCSLLENDTIRCLKILKSVIF